jgi:hypothetical protein
VSDGRRDRPILVGGTAVVVSYVFVVCVMRFWRAFDPYVAETDWKQWVWQYWRYHVDGAFPPGHLLTDYAFAVQPVLFWAPMAALSTVFTPVVAANLLNFVAVALAVGAIYVAVRSRTNHWMGLAAAALLVRDSAYFRVTAGGYPRTFGPTLTLLFLAAWLTGRHRATCVVLVVVAALYPSVVVPCGLAYGLWTTVEAVKTKRWRPFVELCVAGVGVVFFGLLQNTQAPDWYGSVVTLKDAVDMPALGPRGRFPWLPLDPIVAKTWSYALQPFVVNGHTLLKPLTDWSASHDYVLSLAPLVVALGVVAWKRQPFPLQIPLLVACAVLGFVAARELAFRLYLPRRVVQHTIPYVVATALPIAAYLAARALAPARATAAALLVVVLPVFVFSGSGLAIGEGYRSYRKDQRLYRWIERNTPIDAQLAGDMKVLDELPLFSVRQVYVNWKMAHPVRKGYYQENEDRILAMYRAFYAANVDEILDFAQKADVDYFVVDRALYERPQPGETLFAPIDRPVKAMFEANKSRGFALNPAPADAVVFTHDRYDVVDVAKLAAFRGRWPAPAP